MSRLKLNLTSEAFDVNIYNILKEYVGSEYVEDLINSSPLLKYIYFKTKAANRGSKSRGSFANLYALYVLIEDYLNSGFWDNVDAYKKYVGARYVDLLIRQRQLPFGAKLQNHALNARLNDEFRKLNRTIDIIPVIRDIESQRYWINQNLLFVNIRNKNGDDCSYNISRAVIKIIDAYISARKASFEKFIESCKQISELGEKNLENAIEFIEGQLQPNVDARVFEIVSYAVLKEKYVQETVWIGVARDEVLEEALKLYKTGRTNANDGGIDFVMKPLGRFFQVTETVDVTKYFLDIDKVQRFPITFVVKSDQLVENIREDIHKQALIKYQIESVVNAYMAAIEEIINVPMLIDAFNEIVNSGRVQNVMNEIVIQSKVEFNYEEDEDELEDA